MSNRSNLSINHPWHLATRRHRQAGFSSMVLIPMGLFIFMICSAAYFHALISKQSAFTALARSEVSVRQESVNRSALLAFGNQIRQALRGETPTGIDSALASVLNNESLAQSIFEGDSIGSFARGTGNVRVTNLSLGTANPGSDILNDVSSAPSTLTFPSTRIQFGDTSGRFLGKAWSYLVESDYSQQANVGTGSREIISAQATRRTTKITILEVPGQFAIEGGDVTVVGPIEGSVFADRISLQSGSEVQGRATAFSQISWDSNARVKGASLSGTGSSASGMIETLRHTNPTLTGALSVLNQQSTVISIPLGDRTPNAEGISAIFLPPISTSDWDVYSHPYFQTDIRLTLSGITPGVTPDPTLAIPVFSNGKGTIAQRRNESSGPPASFIDFTVQPHPYLPGNIILANVDCAGIPVVNGRRTIYLDFVTTDATYPRQRVGVRLYNGETLDTPFSLVSGNPVFVTGTFNPNDHPCSILAPRVAFGLDNTENFVSFTGSKQSVLPHSARPSNAFIAPQSGFTTPATLRLFDIDPTTPANLPPVNLLNWVIVAEDATNIP
jgi:hypothetical protein